MKFKEFVTKHNLTGDKIAERVGISAQAARKWKRGENTPRMIHLKKLQDLVSELEPGVDAVSLFL